MTYTVAVAIIQQFSMVISVVTQETAKQTLLFLTVPIAAEYYTDKFSYVKNDKETTYRLSQIQLQSLVEKL